jgi:hypothetical protein
MPTKNKNPYTKHRNSSKSIKTVSPFEDILTKAIDYCGLDRFEEAVEILDKAVSLNDFGETSESFKQSVYHTKGGAQLLLGNYNQALEIYQYSLSINPDDLNCLSNLGVLFRYLGEVQSSIKVFEKVIEIDPSFAIAQMNIGYAYLSVGRIKDGLTAVEWRWENPHFKHTFRGSPTSQWNGSQDLSEKTILLWPEQGPQDVIVWASIIPKLIAKANHTIVEIYPKLMPLFERSFPNVEFREAKQTPSLSSINFDLHLPMGSLFLHFTEELHLVCESFLVPDPVRVAYWRQRLEKLGPGPYIGISWKSPVMSRLRIPNYTVIDDWIPVFKMNARFINLQSGDCQGDIDHARQDLGVEIVDFKNLDLFNSLDEAAALSAALDIAITVSTAASAIAAGVGTETWLLSWKESPWNNILCRPRGPNVINFERSIIETWDATFVEISQKLLERGLSRMG